MEGRKRELLRLLCGPYPLVAVSSSLFGGLNALASAGNSPALRRPQDDSTITTAGIALRSALSATTPLIKTRAIKPRRQAIRHSHRAAKSVTDDCSRILCRIIRERSRARLSAASVVRRWRAGNLKSKHFLSGLRAAYLRHRRLMKRKKVRLIILRGAARLVGLIARKSMSLPHFLRECEHTRSNRMPKNDVVAFFGQLRRQQYDHLDASLGSQLRSMQMLSLLDARGATSGEQANTTRPSKREDIGSICIGGGKAMSRPELSEQADDVAPLITKDKNDAPTGLLQRLTEARSFVIQGSPTRQEEYLRCSTFEHFIKRRQLSLPFDFVAGGRPLFKGKAREFLSRRTKATRQFDLLQGNIVVHVFGAFTVLVMPWDQPDVYSIFIEPHERAPNWRAIWNKFEQEAKNCLPCAGESTAQSRQLRSGRTFYRQCLAFPMSTAHVDSQELLLEMPSEEKSAYYMMYGYIGCVYDAESMTLPYVWRVT